MTKRVSQRWLRLTVTQPQIACWIHDFFFFSFYINFIFSPPTITGEPKGRVVKKKKKAKIKKPRARLMKRHRTCPVAYNPSMLSTFDTVLKQLFCPGSTLCSVSAVLRGRRRRDLKWERRANHEILLFLLARVFALIKNPGRRQREHFIHLLSLG